MKIIRILVQSRIEELPAAVAVVSGLSVRVHCGDTTGTKDSSCLKFSHGFTQILQSYNLGVADSRTTILR